MSEIYRAGSLKSRDGTTDYGKPYEQHIPALLGIKCIFDSDIKDMWMATNIDGIGSFDDLILFIERTSGSKHLFLVQIKHKRNKLLNSKILISNDKNFGLAEYEKSFLNIKDKFSEKDELPFSFDGEFQNITFLLFTNIKLNNDNNDGDIIFNEQEEHESLLNTGRIIKICNGNVDKYNHNFLNQFRLYCNQVDVLQIGNKIKVEVGKYFKQLDIDNTVMEYFTDWSQKKFVNKTILTKMDIQAKLLETILTPYIIIPNTEDVFLKAQIWNDITDEFDGIFLKNDKHLSKVYSAVQLKVNKYLDDDNINIINWNGLLYNPSTTINKVLQTLQSHLGLSIKKIKNTYTVKDLIMLLWHACQLPIIINLNAESYTQENVSNAILKFDYSDYKRRYIFFGGKSFDLPHYRVFTSLKQASKQNQLNALRNIEISLQNRKSISLEKLSPNGKSLKEITADIFLDLLQKQPVMNKNVENYYIPRYLRKPLVSQNVLSQKNAIFVLSGNMKQITHKFDFSYELWPYYENLVLPEYRQNYDGDPKLISVIGMQEVPKKYKDIIKTIKQVSENENQTVHFFQLNGDILEWLYSNQNIDMIKPFRIINMSEDHLLSDVNLFNYLNFNVLSDRSGEGKTMLLHYLQDNCPPDMWMIYLNLTDISDYIHNQQFSNIKYFLFDKSNEPQDEHSNFFRELFKNLLNKLRVIIAIDGLDDVKYELNTERFLKCINNLGTPTLLATRPSLKNILEKNFNLLSLYFKPFTEEDQKMVIQKNLNTFSENDLNQIIHKMSSLGNFIGIPLQTELFGRIMENRKDADISKGIDMSNFDISDLYDKYIQIQLSKVNSFNNSTLRTLSRLALLQFYHESKISELFDIQEFYDDVEDKKEIFINSKIIQRIEKKYVIFAHKSLSEFLLAKYLYYLCDTSRHNILRPLLDYLYYVEHETIRIFFDKIILKSSPLHKAVLENNEELFDRLIKDIKIDSKDKLGRHVLHVAAACGKSNELRMARTLSSDVKILYSYNEKIGNDIYPSIEYNRPTQISVNFLRRLLSYKLDPYKKDNLFNMDVFDFAIQSSSLEVLEELFANNYFRDLEAVDADILLYRCVKEGYWNLFKNINSKNFKIKNKMTGENLLHTALYAENFKILNEIINNFSNVDEPNSMGISPLLSWFTSPKLSKLKKNILTIQCRTKLNENQMNILELFIEKKANVNSTTILGPTPFHFICLTEHVSLIKKLIKHGAEVNKKTINGETPLHYASCCSIENVRMLVRNRSDINSTSNFGITPLCNAAKHGKLDILKYLIKKGAKVNKNSRRISPLILAIRSGNTECVEVLVKNGADVNQIDMRGMHPLIVAAEMGHVECLQLLIDETIFSANLSFDALYKAAEHGNEKAFDYLASRGININMEYDNMTLLHKAVLNIDKECIRLLLSKGFNINVKTKNGTTPLHVAATWNLKNMLEYLISEGADVNEEDNNTETALITAASYNHLDCLKLLINSGSDLKKYGSEAIYSAALKDYHEIIDFLLLQGVDINGRLLDENSPIKCAVIDGELECLKTLLLKGADINLKDLSGRTSIFYAAEKDDPTILKHLLSCGADLNIKDNDGNTVLHAAVYSRYTENVQAILEKDVNIYDANNAEETSVNIAEKNGCHNIKGLLLKYNNNDQM